MTNEFDRLQKENEHYKNLLGIGDVATRGYTVIVKLLEQQISYLNKFNLEDNINKTTKDDPVYERSQKMFKEMPEVILSLKELKDKLGIEYVEKETKRAATTPQSIAKLLS